MAKAKVDEGKSPSEKGDARRMRNDRELVGHPDRGNGVKIVGTPKQVKKDEEMDKCGDMNKSNKLKDFLDKKMKKKELKKIGGASASSGMGGGSLPGSTATTGAPSIASQIGFGKGEMKKARVDEGKGDEHKRENRRDRNDRKSIQQKDLSAGNKVVGKPKKEKGVHHPHYMAGKNTGTSQVGAYQGSGAKLGSKTVAALKEQHKEVQNEQKQIKAPNLPKAENDMAKPVAAKAIGLKPLSPVDGNKAPKIDDASKPPKPATTLKSFMAQKKK